jgi:pimeloyl-ACP methyl ester carboxylesterase
VEVTTVVEVVKSVTATPLPTATPGPINGQFNAGGVNLNLICRGEGSPTVVLDAGWGMDHLTWYAIMPKIQSHTRVCVYDRASMGNSDKQAGHRTSQKIAEQLHTLLANAKVEGPYIVVGHSLGGMNMLVFADRFRGEVAGAVLVDSAHPDQRERLLAILPTPAPDEPAGLRRLREDLPLANPRDPRFPEPMDWDSTLAQVRAVKSLSSIPLSVLVAADPKKTKFKGIPNEMAASLDKVWLDLQKEHAALSSDSQLILAEHSGHFIQNDEPQLVIDAILGLVDKARQK